MRTLKNNGQGDRVRQWLESGRSITGLVSFTKLGIMHLPSAIRDLKESGYPVSSRWIPVRNRYGEKGKVKQYFKTPAEPVNN